MNAPIIENVKYDIQGSYDGQWWAKRNDYSYANADHARRVAAELATAETYGQQFRVIEVRETWTVVAPAIAVHKADMETAPVSAQENEKPDASEPVWQAAQFGDFAVGDRIRFQTIDNGFGGSGDFVLRTGTVTAVTARTLRVQCDGSGSWLGDRARLTRAGWYGRAPQRAVVAAEAPARTLTGPKAATCSCLRGESEIYKAHHRTVCEAGQCRHGHTPRPDVTGDPIAACAKGNGGTEWGAFSDEGCYYAYDCAVDVANESAKQNEEDGADADEPVSTWGEMCRDHRDQEQPLDGCEECNAETDDEDDDQGESDEV